MSVFGWQPHNWRLEGLVPFEASLTVVKHKHSALVGTVLGDWLKAQGIERLVVSGIRTEQCCETTTRHASDEGWKIDFAFGLSFYKKRCCSIWRAQHKANRPINASGVVTLFGINGSAR